jgi:methylmalonyl-CoA/ethylmalonyl-CoA epimerase
VSRIRRLDHVAIAVRDTDAALAHFSGTLGLRVVERDALDSPRVRLTYLDAGNAYIQLVETLDPSSDIGRWLELHGEGVHHVCFGVDDVADAVRDLSSEADRQPVLGRGRGRISGFVMDGSPHGVVVECTEFRHPEDVERTLGWLP